MKISKYLLIFNLLAVAGCTSYTAEDEPVPNERKDIVLSRSESEIVSTQNSFSLKFFNEAIKCEDKNMIVSPLSMSMALSMLSNGAVGDTRTEMIEVLGFEGKDMDAVNTFNNRLTAELAAVDNTVVQSLANSIWIDYTASIKQPFIDDNKAAYNADIFIDNLYGSESVNRINGWCRDKTNGMIYPFLKKPVDGLIALINALYFKGRWTSPFDKSNTTRSTFHNADGSTSSVDMMTGSFGCRQTRIRNASWVSLFYGNRAYEAIFILPDADCGLSVDEYMASLNADEFNGGMNGSLAEVNIKLPKFDITYRNDDMNNILYNIGFKKMFTSEGDFTGITDIKLGFEVIQEAKIILDENGTEASAVTAIVGISSPGPMPMCSITLDRPFAFAIRETSTRSVLFMGRVSGF